MAGSRRDGSLWPMPPTGDPQMVPQDPLPGPEDVPGARKLTRSTTDKHVWGVAGGLGRYFGIDPVHLPRRVRRRDARRRHRPDRLHRAAAASCRRDDGEPAVDGGPLARHDDRRHRRAVRSSRSRRSRAAGFFVGPGLFVVAGVQRRSALALYRGFGGARGEDPAKAIARATLVAARAGRGARRGDRHRLVAAIGGGVAVAMIAIAAGLGLIAAGLLGGPRWLILPVIVLVCRSPSSPPPTSTCAAASASASTGRRGRRPAPGVPAGRRPHGPRPAPRGAARRTTAGQRHARHGRGARARARRDLRGRRTRRSASARPTCPSAWDEGIDISSTSRTRRRRRAPHAASSTPTSASGTCRSTDRGALRVRRGRADRTLIVAGPGDDRARRAAAARPPRRHRCPLRLHAARRCSPRSARSCSRRGCLDERTTPIAAAPRRPSRRATSPACVPASPPASASTRC